MNRLTGGNLTAGPIVISVLSGKGGVGKSILAYNLAERMSSQMSRVLLVDADLTGGNLPVLANTDADSGLERYLAKSSPLIESVTKVSENLDLLGRSTNEPLTDMGQVAQQAAFIKRLRFEGAGYDRIILDQSSGVTEFAAVIAGGSDINLLVLVPELTSISDCYGLFKYLHKANAGIDCRLVINRTVSDEETQDVFSRFSALAEKFLGAAPSLAGSLPEDPLVRRAVALQQPLVAIDSQAAILQELSQIDRRITGSVASNTVTRINNLTAMADIRE